MSVMRDLFYGAFCPCDHPVGRKYKKVLDRLCDAEEALTAQLDEDGESVYERLTDCQRELSGLDQLDSFIQGVRFGVRLMVEVFQEQREER